MIRVQSAQETTISWAQLRQSYRVATWDFDPSWGTNPDVYLNEMPFLPELFPKESFRLDPSPPETCRIASRANQEIRSLKLWAGRFVGMAVPEARVYFNDRRRPLSFNLDTARSRGVSVA
jgi:hypothetical protein